MAAGGAADDVAGGVVAPLGERVLPAFVGLVVTSGLGLLAWVCVRTDYSTLGPEPQIYLVFALLVVIGELRPITIARREAQDSITVSTTFALALAFIGPLWLALAIQGGAVALEDARSRAPLHRLLFNVAQYVLTLCAARAAFTAWTGAPFLYGQPFDVPEQLPAALLAAAVFFFVNQILISTAGSLGRPAPLSYLRSDLSFQFATSGVLLSFAPVVAAVSALSLWLVPFLLLPVLAIYKSVELAALSEREALHDTLTGLPNRALFQHRVIRAVEEIRGGRLFAVLLVDLDHFKDINDTLGHHVGDELLKDVAARINDSLRTGDLVARFGGDEFAVYAGDIQDAAEAVVVGTRLLAALQEPFRAGAVRLDVQASLGIALFPEHGQDVEALLQRADIALYSAKDQRGGCRLYEPSTDVHSLERLALASELRDALERGELFVSYQPKVDAVSGQVRGFEALVRWQHPRHGVLMPDAFLPVVEHTGLMAPLTMAVLHMSLQAAAGWRRAGHDVTIAVNLSVRHLTDLELPCHVAALLEEYDVPGTALLLEVTETVIMSDPTRAMVVLSRLRELGIAIAVDDFGTGYSSLAYLRQLHLDELKIDKSFVVNLARDEGDAVIVRSTIELGHNLGLRLVAEGVEDDEALRLLQGWGCDLIQGYLISHPLASADVLAWMQDRPHSPGPASLAPPVS